MTSEGLNLLGNGVRVFLFLDWRRLVFVQLCLENDMGPLGLFPRFLEIGFKLICELLSMYLALAVSAQGGWKVLAVLALGKESIEILSLEQHAAQIITGMWEVELLATLQSVTESLSGEKREAHLTGLNAKLLLIRGLVKPRGERAISGVL